MRNPNRNYGDTTADIKTNSRCQERPEAYIHVSYLPTVNRDADLQHDARVALLLRTRLLQLTELAVRQVPSREDDKHRAQMHDQRQEEGEAPRQVDLLVRDRHENVEHDRGEGIRHTTPKVAPASCGRVGGTDLWRSGCTGLKDVAIS